ncbi:hypothetical protein GLP37_20345 [Photobacterium phosphoreum]|nr:hypothetical protein [Photobacterium phosphoreum]
MNRHLKDLTAPNHWQIIIATLPHMQRFIFYDEQLIAL